MPRSPRSLVLKGYTNTSLEELKWIRYAADRLQAWTWRGKECESQTPDKKKNNKKNNFTSICNFTQNTQKCIITRKENQQKMFPLGEEQEGKKVKPPTSALVETTWGALCALLSYAVPNPAPTQIPALNWALTRTQSYSLSQPADLQLMFIESEKPSG